MKFANLQSFALAEEMLGNDFITPDQVRDTCQNIEFSELQLIELARCLPKGDEIQWCLDNGCAVIPAPPGPMSLWNVQQDDPKNFKYYQSRCESSGFEGCWYSDQVFAHHDKTSAGWLAIRKTPLPRSINGNWNEQKLHPDFCHSQKL